MTTCPVKDSSGCLSGIFDNMSGSSQNDPAQCAELATSKCVNWRTSAQTTESTIVLAHRGRFVANPTMFITDATVGGLSTHMKPNFVVERGANGRVVIDLTDVAVDFLAKATPTATSQSVVSTAEGIDNILGPASTNPGDAAALKGDSTVVRPDYAFSLQNRSECAAYINAGKSFTFEGVSQYIGVRPRERVSFLLNPVTLSWFVTERAC